MFFVFVDSFTLCPTDATDSITTTDDENNSKSNDNSPNSVKHQESCLWPNALQVSQYLLRYFPAYFIEIVVSLFSVVEVIMKVLQIPK